MKRATLFVALVVVWCTQVAASPHLGDSDSSSQGRGFFKSLGTVSMQVLVGSISGMAGASLSGIHPVVGGVGWIVGSSVGVWTIGDEGTGRGNFWWTCAAGTAVVLAFTPAIAKTRDFGVAFAVAAAAVASLTAEVVAYHISERPPYPRLSISLGLPDTGRAALSNGAANEGTATLCLVFSVRF